MSIRIQVPLAGLASGLIFGLGLSVSQMTNPDKVLSFLDIFGEWDPSLIFTMGAAILVTTVGYKVVLKKGSVFSSKLHLPARTDIDARLLLGSATFGVGWGIAGYCPGPVIAGISNSLTEPVVFLVAMLIGSQLERLWLLQHPVD